MQIFYLLFLFGMSVPSIFAFLTPINVKKEYRPIPQMNLINRFFRVVTSNVNNVIKQFEDPEKILDQAVNDMQNDLVKIRQSYAEVTATQKRMQTQKTNAENLANDWYKRAQLALQKGDEELAREALSRKRIQMDVAENLGKQLAIQTSAVEKLYSSMGQLESKIVEAKRQKESFIARARTAKTTVQVNDMLNNIVGSSTGSNAMEAFERMKEKVEKLEAEAEVSSELAASSSGSTSVSLEERFRLLEGGSVIDDELERMKNQLPGSKATEAIPQLPPSIASKPMSAIDIEYERLKKELGRS
jgi:phage shock protein A